MAARTGRNVTLDDVYGRVLAYNTSLPTTDRARIDAVMLKAVPEDVRAWESAAGAVVQTRPFIVPGNPERSFLARLCIPLVVRGVRVGLVWILARDENDPLDALRDEVAADHDAVDQLARRAAAAIESENIAEATHRAIFREALLGRSLAHALADRLGSLQSACVVTLSLPARHGANASSERLLATHAIGDALRALALDGVVLVEDDHVVVALNRADSADLLAARFAAAVDARLLQPSALDTRLDYGVSSSFSALEGISDAYNEAVVALQAPSVDPGLASHRYEDVGFYRYAQQLVAAPRDELLARIAAVDSQNLTLLERIFDTDAPMQSIATDMHMHRTSVYNRLQRIRAIIGADPLSSMMRLQLHAGLKLARWANRPEFDLHLTWQSFHRALN